MFGLSSYLASHGHEVIPFAVGYRRNEPSMYESYFLKPIGDGTQTKLTDFEGGGLAKLKAAGRAIYSVEARRAMSRLISETNPDLLYCLNIVNHISPSIIDAADRKGVPVVMRTSDFYLVCPSFLFLRDGQVCKDCLRGSYRALGHKCVNDSFAATLARVCGMYRAAGIYKKVSAFVTPTRMMRDALIEAGFPSERVHHIPTFVDSSRWTPRYDNDGYILYLGRLSPEKGVEFLLDAYNASDISDQLYIVGDGPADYVAELNEKVDSAKREQVRFLGAKSGDELREVVLGAKFVVVPSLCLDNAPNVVYEAFAAGKPVVGSAIGGLIEQVTPETGVLVEPGNVEALSDKMSELASTPDLLESLGRNARALVEKENSIELHVERLLGLFKQFV